MARFPLKLSLALFGILVVGFGVGIASGIALRGEGQEPALRAELEEARANLEDAQERLTEAEELASDRYTEVLALQDEIAELQAVQAEQAPPAEPPPPEEPVASPEQETISDGIWQVGVDFPPGLYRAPGGDSCYWALLRSANTQAIINNGGFGPNQTLQIDSPWFETSDCGPWARIG